MIHEVCVASSFITITNISINWLFLHPNSTYVQQWCLRLSWRSSCLWFACHRNTHRCRACRPGRDAATRCAHRRVCAARTQLWQPVGEDTPLHLKVVCVPPKRISSLTHVTLGFILYQIMSALSLQWRPGQGIFPPSFTRRCFTPSSSWKHPRLFLSSTCRWKDQFLPLDRKKHDAQSTYDWTDYLLKDLCLLECK